MDALISKTTGPELLLAIRRYAAVERDSEEQNAVARASRSVST